MGKFKNFIGIDISKKTFDVHIIKEGIVTVNCFSQFTNDKKGFITLFKWLKKEKVCVAETLICIEHTGIYKNLLSDFILNKKGNLWVEMSLKINRSMGLQRGKSDKIDAKRIAIYAQKNQSDFIPFVPHRKIILHIKQLLNVREALVDTKKKLNVQIKEIERIDKALGKKMTQTLNKTLKAINTDLKAVETKIQKFINEDEALLKLFKLVTSVPGIGLITFSYLIYFTNEFKQYQNAKQLACYCGVVPFEYSSGTSVKGKAKVHKMANKTVKHLLHLSALTCITNYEEFRVYYQRKQAEGKNNMLILNNIRNKLILRIATVVKHQKPYEVKMAA